MEQHLFTVCQLCFGAFFPFPLDESQGRTPATTQATASYYCSKLGLASWTEKANTSY